MSLSLESKIFWRSAKYIGASIGPALWVAMVPGTIEARTVHGVLFQVYSLPLYVIIAVSGIMYLDFYRRATSF
jgi:hypothetical protein